MFPANLTNLYNKILFFSELPSCSQNLFKSILGEEKEETAGDMNGTIILSKGCSQTLFKSGILDILQDTPAKVQTTPANMNETVTIGKSNF